MKNPKKAVTLPYFNTILYEKSGEFYSRIDFGISNDTGFGNRRQLDFGLTMDKKLFWTGYVAGLLLTVGIGYYAYHKLTAVPEIDLAKIQLENLSGIPLNSAHRSGKPLIVNFWATWCGPCREEFPAFNKAYEKYGDRVNFVMVSDEAPEKITSFKSLKMYPFMFVRSTESLDTYGIHSIPLTYFYNAKGEQVGQKSGGLSESELEKEIQKILTEAH